MNKIGVEGAKVISEALKSNTALTYLSLSCDYIYIKEERENEINR